MHLLRDPVDHLEEVGFEVRLEVEASHKLLDAHSLLVWTQ